MKKLLFRLLLLLLFSQCRISDIIYKEINAKNAPNGKVTVAFREKQYVVNFPNNGDSVQMRQYLEVRGFRLFAKCPCADSLQLWGGVDLIPDGDNPPKPVKPIGGNITQNFIVLEDDSVQKFRVPRIQPAIGCEQSANEKPTVKIAIVDSGIELSSLENVNSPFLSRNSNPGYACQSQTIPEGIFGINILNRLNVRRNAEPRDFDGHGTFINGVLSCKASLPVEYRGNNVFIGNNENVNLKLLHTKFVKNRSQGANLYDGLCGIHYALQNGAEVINVSWRALSNLSNRDSLKNAFIPTLYAIKEKNALLVTGSGNDKLKDLPADNSSERAIVFPASFSRDNTFGNYVMTVGAWDLGARQIATFSNEGEYVDIYAPGVDITSTFITRGEFRGSSLGSGTSYATPFIARTAAILRGSYPDASWKRIKSLIKQHSQSQYNDNIRLLDVPTIMSVRNELEN